MARAWERVNLIKTLVTSLTLFNKEKYNKLTGINNLMPTILLNA
jgi:hypothetical protein